MRTIESIPLHLLRTLTVFSQTGKMSTTAKLLGVTQPAVSLQFKQLQSLLEHPIMQRQGQMWVLTQYGQELARSLTPAFDRLSEEWRRVNLFYGDPRNSVLQVGCRKELFAHLSGFAEFPGRVHFYDLRSSEAISRLLQSELDIVLSHERPDVFHVKCHRLFTQSTRMLVHRKWVRRSTSRESLITDREFAESTPWIVYNRSAEFIRYWLKHARLNGEHLFVKAEVQDWAMITALVARGYGFAIVPAGVECDDPNVLQIEIPEDIIPPRKFYLLYQEQVGSQPFVRQLIQSLLDESKRRK